MKNFHLIGLLLFCLITSCSLLESNEDSNNDVKDNTRAQSEEPKQTGTESITFTVCTFADALAIEGDVSYIFKNKDGNEVVFHHNPLEDAEINYTLLDEELLPNEKFVNKTFKVKFTEVQRQNENTGEIEKIKKLESLEIVE